MDLETMIELASSARSRAYAPYSRFPVGAALLTRSGHLFTGCNVENLSFGLTICAERAALFSAIAAGHREFVRLVVVADTEEPISPCGACRQSLAEFSETLEIVSVTLSGQRFVALLGTLFPRAKTGILNLLRST